MLHFSKYKICLVLVLMGLINSSFCDVPTKRITKRHTQADWLAIPSLMINFIYESVKTISPETAEIFKQMYNEQAVHDAGAFLIHTTENVIHVVSDMCKSIRSYWEIEEQQK